MKNLLALLLSVVMVCLFCVGCGNTVDKTEVVSKTETILMETQFKDLGFTDAEAQKMKEIFTTVGITEIYDIQSMAGSGIDKLQSFKAALYDTSVYKWGASTLFTIDKRQLCFISINSFKNNITGEYDSATLYDKWDENGKIDTNSIGYKAVLDYENKEIVDYEEFYNK